MLPVEPPFQTYASIDGAPLDSGYIYFGAPGQDPVTHPVSVYWDADGTIPALQPLRTVNGYIAKYGSPANVFIDGAYSVLVRDAQSVDIFYSPTSEQFGVATMVRDFISSIITSTGASVIGFIASWPGAIKRWVLDKLRERVSPLDFDAKGDGIADDSSAIEKAANSGAKKIDYCGLTYKVTRQIRLYTSGVTHDMRGATITQATTNTDVFLIGYDGTAFAKTDDTTFLGGSLVGADNGLTTTVSTGIGVYAPAVVPYAEGSGCSRIKVLDTKFDGFCTSIAATGADNLEVDGIYSTNMQYHLAAGAGGYGVLAQACFNVKIGARNLFKAGANSRHAIYISADPGRAKDANNVCKGVSIGACRVEWDAVSGVTGFEAPIYIRSAFNASVNGPVITGGFGGVTYDLENAPAENITIANVQATNVRSSAAGEVSGIQFTRSSGTYRAKNVTVTGCTVQLSRSNTHGIQLAYIDGLTSGGHTIGRKTDSYLSGIYTVDCTDVTYNPSSLSGTWASAAMDFAKVSVTTDNIQIGRSTISGAGPKYRFYAVPTNMRFNYPRRFAVTANGAGSVTATSSDGEVLTTGVASEPNGFTVTFPPEIAPTPDNFDAVPVASSITSIYHRAAAGQAVTFGVNTVVPGPPAGPAPLPAATNAYSVQITILR